MKSGKGLRSDLSATLLVATVSLLISTAAAYGQEVQHLTITQPGGMPGMPVVTGIERVTNGVKITWDGPPGYYQLLRRWGLTTQSWEPYLGPSATRNTTVTNLQGDAFFRVSGPSPQYAGAQACAECHQNVHTAELHTQHAGAFTNSLFVARGGQTNSSCLPCHTVGFGLPTGFVSKDDPNTNPRLAGVQCESCHGPAANHAANENDTTVRPRAEIASTVCGGCHNAISERPHYEEWITSGHATVTEENMNATSCGRCHIGSARLAMIKSDPVLQNDRHVGITCVVCHDPHANHVWTNQVSGLNYTNQLRSPLSSTNDYFLTTSDVFTNSALTVFTNSMGRVVTNKYNANVNVCAQCHNHRGASWTSSSRPPHHSPQYNMLLATVGVVPTNVSVRAAAHAGTKFLTDFLGQQHLVTNQCVTCHMQTQPHQAGPPEVAAVTGHEFRVTSFAACADCHGSGANEESLRDWRDTITARIQEVKGMLDTWATNNAPDNLRTKYGALGWEYYNAGELSSPDGTLRGPVSSTDPNLDEQKFIPDTIKMARFNLYLVAYDGSLGVHNPIYSHTLLDTARDWVAQELYE